MLRGIVHEFVHKPLTISLHLRGTRICRRHLREVGIHTTVPTTETHYILIRLKVPYIETLTGGADERTRAAAEARLGEFLPYGQIEKFV